MKIQVYWGALTLGACAAALSAGGCASSLQQPPFGPPQRLELQGTLALADGTPVPHAPLRLACGATPRTTRTGQSGAFTFSSLLPGACQIISSAASIDETIQIAPGMEPLRLVVPPMHRVSLSWRDGDERVELILQESITHPVVLEGRSIRLERGRLIAGERSVPLGKLRPGRTIKIGGLPLTIEQIEAMPWMPPALRDAPRAEDIYAAPMMDEQHRWTTLPRSLRSLIYLSRCDELDPPLVQRLAALAAEARGTGLTAAVVAVGTCHRRNLLPVPVFLGGEEILWAMEARPGMLVLLDQSGQLLLNRQARGVEAVEAAAEYLDRTWSPFAATRRVAVVRAPSLARAEAARLLSQAEHQGRTGRLQEAHLLLDQLLLRSPNLAAARRQRAMIKIRLGDLSGAMREVSWWRSNFGPEAADDLMDAVTRHAKVSALR